MKKTLTMVLILLLILSGFMMEIKDNFDALEKIDTTNKTEISTFVAKILEDEGYTYLKSCYDEPYIKNAQNDADLNRLLDKALGGFDATVAYSLLFDAVKLNIESRLRTMPKELPDKYNK